MSTVYETIARGKQREQAQASVLRQIVSGLEPPYAGWLQDWERLFAGMRDRARAAAQSGEAPTGILTDAQAQTREFARQLGLFRKHSAAARSMPGLASLLDLMRQDLTEHGEGDAGMERRAAPETGGTTGSAAQQFAAETDSTWSNPLGDSGGKARDDHGREPAMTAGASWSAGAIGNAGAGKPVPIGGHTLPPLPYAYNALEPWIDEKTMRIHHDKHHKSYVDGLNKAEKKLEEARRSGDFDLVKHWERELAFNGAGHYLHTIFWDAMSPKGGGEPGGPLAEEIGRSFGSFEAFKKQFSEAANKVEGGGWAILVWSPRSRRLEILTAEKHQNLSQWDVVPLLPLDVWEHAYYLKHQNDRAAYVKDWWNVVNWPYVADRFSKARMLQWAPF